MKRFFNLFIYPDSLELTTTNYKPSEINLNLHVTHFFCSRAILYQKRKKMSGILESSFSIWYWHLSKFAGVESNQTWPIWNSFIIAIFKVNSLNVTAKKQRTRKFLKLISCEEKNIVILVPINLYYSKWYDAALKHNSSNRKYVL